MKILREAKDDLIWTDEAEKMLSYYRAGSIDRDLENFTKGYFNRYDMDSMMSYLKGQKSQAMRDFGDDRQDPKIKATVKANRDKYDELVHIMPDDEYNKLKVEFIKKYNTPVPAYDPWTHEFSDNGISRRSTRNENGEFVKLDLRHLLGLDGSLEESVPRIVTKKEDIASLARYARKTSVEEMLNLFDGRELAHAIDRGREFHDVDIRALEENLEEAAF